MLGIRGEEGGRGITGRGQKLGSSTGILSGAYVGAYVQVRRQKIGKERGGEGGFVTKGTPRSLEVLGAAVDVRSARGQVAFAFHSFSNLQWWLVLGYHNPTASNNHHHITRMKINKDHSLFHTRGWM